MSYDQSRPIANVGMGVMGTKVAWASARAGVTVHCFDAEPGRTAGSIELALSWSDGEEREQLRRHLVQKDTLAAAIDGVQLAFENVPERLQLKQEVHVAIAKLLPADAFQGTNASAMTCTSIASALPNSERFFALNFTDPRYMKLVELMTPAAAGPDTVEFACDWARSIGMVPVVTRKEQLGYSFNRLWRVIKKEVLRQIAEGYTTAEDIDRAWMLGFGTDYGPCGLMDDIGLHSVAAVERIYADDSGDPSDQPPAFLLEMIEAGRRGVIDGQGFYEHPEPLYREPGFLDATSKSSD